MSCYARGLTVGYRGLSESEADNYILDVFEDKDLAVIDKTATKYLDYTNDYVPGWGSSEAFQETHQNWQESPSVVGAPHGKKTNTIQER